MSLSLIQIFLVVFLVFALSRVYLRLKIGNLGAGEFLFWTSLFAFALVGVLEPEFTSYVARFFGIGRGADIVVYFSLALLFYLIFRTNVMLEDLRHEITKIVRYMSLSEIEGSSKSKKKK